LGAFEPEHLAYALGTRDGQYAVTFVLLQPFLRAKLLRQSLQHAQAARPLSRLLDGLLAAQADLQSLRGAQRVAVIARLMGVQEAAEEAALQAVAGA
jgi:hypothetical protein